MTIGKRIKKLRQDKNLTQQKLADSIEISQNGVALIESDKRNPSNRTIALICKTYRVNEAWLRTGEGEMFLPRDEKHILDDATLTAADRALLLAYIEATPETRAAIHGIVLDAAGRIRAAGDAPPADGEKPAPEDAPTKEEYMAALETAEAYERVHGRGDFVKKESPKYGQEESDAG